MDFSFLTWDLRKEPLETPVQTSDVVLKFEDLIWHPHPSVADGERALIQYPNGYGASIVRGGPFYTTGGTYELAVLNDEGEVDYSTHITSDVLGYLSEKEVTNILKDIFELESNE